MMTSPRVLKVLYFVTLPLGIKTLFHLTSAGRALRPKRHERNAPYPVIDSDLGPWNPKIVRTYLEDIPNGPVR